MITVAKGQGTWDSTFQEDARIRDFSINAIYFDLLNSTLVDPFNGRDAIKKRTISTCGSYSKNLFAKDPKRLVLRLLRLY